MFGKEPEDDLQKELREYRQGYEEDFEDVNVNEDDFNKSKKNLWVKNNKIELENGEYILWQGENKLDEQLKKAFKVVGYPWLAFSILWTVLAAAGGGIFGFFGIPFIVIGVMLVKGKFRNGARYIITNKRIIDNWMAKNGIYYSQITKLECRMSMDSTGSIFYQTDRLTGTIPQVENVSQVYEQMRMAISKVQGKNL